MIDYSKIVPQRVATLKPSGIRKFFDVAATMEDVVSLGVGEPDFVTPEHIRNAGIKSILDGKTAYTANYGLIELRRGISEYLEKRFDLSYHPEKEVLVTVGGSEAIDLCMSALIDDGDEVLLPEPLFVSYAPLAIAQRGVPVVIETKEEDSFKLTPQALKAAITPKTKLLVFSYPNNPTGAIMTKEEMEEIAAILRDTNIVVISDEIYAELTYGRRHVSIATLPGMRERTVVVSGFSKAFAMTGWRLGYCCAPVELMTSLGRLHQYKLMCASGMSQRAGLEAITKGIPDIEYMREKFNERRLYLHKALTDLGFDCFMPEGAFYMFPSIRRFASSSEQFCTDLLNDQRVAVVPGDAFGACGEGHVRISYAYSLESLKVAMDRIEKFVNKK
ncbi:aminotransferase class I/II-fold pyridoxal phosphate-dependent enzyme [Ruminococcaceae bacterium AM07-15]|mgnify:FL=1|nr:aminotransferase class I/II-fold pyridoxal phosphate-dependent enzyme [Ruminococcaceae bacterium AM07-15]